MSLLCFIINFSPENKTGRTAQSNIPVIARFRTFELHSKPATQRFDIHGMWPRDDSGCHDRTRSHARPTAEGFRFNTPLKGSDEDLVCPR